jgi:hypothetical protein
VRQYSLSRPNGNLRRAVSLTPHLHPAVMRKSRAYAVGIRQPRLVYAGMARRSRTVIVDLESNTVFDNNLGRITNPWPLGFVTSIASYSQSSLSAQKQCVLQSSLQRVSIGLYYALNPVLERCYPTLNRQRLASICCVIRPVHTWTTIAWPTVLLHGDHWSWKFWKHLDWAKLRLNVHSTSSNTAFRG